VFIFIIGCLKHQYYFSIHDTTTCINRNKETQQTKRRNKGVEMINREQLLYGRQKMKEKFDKEQEQKEQTRKKNDAIYNAFASTTYIPPLVDMKNALQEVRKQNEISHPDEYLRITGGGNRLKGIRTK